MAVCFNYFLCIAIFLNIDISRGSVAKRLRCGGIFKYELVANLPVSLPVKEFWKSVNIWGSYGQEFGVLFFGDTVYSAEIKNWIKGTLSPETRTWQQNLMSHITVTVTVSGMSVDCIFCQYACLSMMNDITLFPK